MIAPRDFDALPAAGPPLHQPGDIVRHKRYGYRGVVVAVDAMCLAPDSWYHNNQTQPDRDQPWYHLLVDGSDQCTYAAQCSLDADSSTACIIHPWVNLYFDAFTEGSYQRNDTPWPHGWA